MQKTLPTRLGHYFFNGLVALLPLLLTLYILRLILRFADNILAGPFKPLLGPYQFPGLGIIVTFIFIVIIGMFTTNVLFKRIAAKGEQLFLKIPFVKSIYSSIKQINDLIFLQNETKSFQRVCAVEYPRKGVYSIGFLTGKAVHELKKYTTEEMVNVFIPTTPSPATGFLVVVPRSEVRLLDLRLEDAVKLIVSGGVLTTKEK